MNTRDSLQRFIFENTPVRGELIHLEHSFQTIVNQHPYPFPIRQLLGEALAVAGLLSAIIKFDGRLSVQFQGEGKLKMLLAQCDNQFNLRGLAKWEGDTLTYADLMTSVSQGVLVIMLDAGPYKQRYQGIVAWRGNSLVESIEGYFQDSEQLATKINLAVSETSAAGILLQAIPQTKSQALDLTQTLATREWQHLAELTAYIQADDLLTLDSAELLQKQYPGEEIRLFAGAPVQFHCSCSRKRSEGAILVLGKTEAEAELKSKKQLIITCDFCNQAYTFDAVDVAAIFEKDEKPFPPSHLH